MKKMLLPFALVLFAATQASRAAPVDLTTFTSTVGTNSAIATTMNMAALIGTTTLTGNVAGLQSFQYDFTAGDVSIDVFDDYSYIHTSAGSTQLADIAAVGDFGSTGWQTYTFATAYSGLITFGVANVGDDNQSSGLMIRQVVAAVTPVPEPEQYAMLAAGLGLVATVIVRRKRSFATT